MTSKIIITSILLLFTEANLFAQNEAIKKTFIEFQTALLKKDCEKLVAISSFPIEGDMGLARLINSDDPSEEMEKQNYKITKELLIQNCLFLDSTELQVLTQFDFNKQDSENGVKYSDCIYKSHIYIANDKSYFQWSVGCVELINQSIGEYSMIFTFKLIDGEYKLKQIHGAG